MALEGWVEWCTAEQVSGWAWDSERPDARLAVEIYHDDTLICRLPADNYRIDLKDVGVGDGAYGFTYRSPLAASEPGKRISVIVAGSNYALPVSPVAELDFNILMQLDDPNRVESLSEIMRKYQCQKPSNYLPVYEHLMEPLRFLPLSLLELGINDGASLQAWATYFPYAQIAGVDLHVPTLPVHDRIHAFAGHQADTAVLAQLGGEIAPSGFDIIIDDCAHLGMPAKASFWYLFENHLKPGGLYIIEDWGTGYWPWWPDGRDYVVEADSRQRMPSHNAGMVGFIKQLVDELHAMPQDQPRTSKFISMTLHTGLCIIKKAAVRA